MLDGMKTLRKRGLLRTGVLLLLASLVLTAAPAGEDPGETLEIIRRVISERGEYDLAERQLEAFIEGNRGAPSAAEALVLLGYCLDKQKKNADAVAAYARVVDEYPTAPAQLHVSTANPIHSTSSPK